MTALPRFVGVVGRKGHGKSAVAEILKDFMYRTCYFADPLKRTVMEIYDLSYAQVYGTIAEKEAVDPRWGLTPRDILQNFGTEVGRSVHSDTWVRALREQIRRFEVDGEIPEWSDGTRRIKGWRWTTGTSRPGPVEWVIGDTRFHNEVAAIKAWGGTVWRVRRPGFQATGVGEDHESERYADSLPVDRELINDGTLADLKTKVAAAVKAG